MVDLRFRFRVRCLVSFPPPLQIRKHLADLKESLKKAEDNVSKRARGSD